jgi:hypothetical protein
MYGPFNHLLHAFLITIVLYLIMLFGLRQSSTKALNRSLLIGAISLIYMILFGHSLPTHVNNI